ncbi:MAG: hypothetical protein HC860_14035 [Alkalinema sp. RU_4_3]|nr:hypothetical protein [Alkalinema sp. RU_4_3]
MFPPGIFPIAVVDIADLPFSDAQFAMQIKLQLQRLTLEVTSNDGDVIDYMEGLFHSTYEDGSHEIIWRLDKGQFYEQHCALPIPNHLLP